MSEKKNILVFIDWYYPGFKAGGPVRSCRNMVAGLKGDFNFYIVTGNTEYTEIAPYKNIDFNKWLDGPDFEKVIYLDSSNRNIEKYISLMEEREYASVMIMGLFSRSFSIQPLKAANKISFERIIVSPRGMLADSALQIKPFKKKLFLTWANITGLYRSVIFHVSNAGEEGQVKKRIKKYREIVIADNFSRKAEINFDIDSAKIQGKLKLVSVARIAPEKNTLFAIKLLKECKGDIELDLYGSVYDQEYWNECKKQIDILPSNIKVNYKEHLESDKLFDVLSRHDFLFLPTRGENFGHIILESFICGLPVVISDKTPWLNLQSQKTGFAISLQDKPGFINCINELVNWDSSVHQEWKINAHEFGKSRSDISELVNQYKNLLQ